MLQLCCCEAGDNSHQLIDSKSGMGTDKVNLLKFNVNTL